MKNRRIGRTNLHVSELGLNTVHFGWLAESKSQGILDAFHKKGGTFIQTGGTYSQLLKDETPSARAEEVVGDWLKERAIPRGNIVWGTRVNLARPNHGGSIHFANLIRQSCERSLRRLKTDHVDLVTCEWDQALGPIDDVMEAYDQLIRAGMVRHVVAGGFPPWRVVDSLHRSSLRNRCRFEAIEAEFSLATAGASEAESLRMSLEHRIGFLARSPLAAGFLSKRPVSIREIIYSERNLVNESQSVGNAILTTLARIADRRGASSGQIALAWVLSNPHVSAALVDPEASSMLEELVQATDLILSDDELDALSKVSPRAQVDFARVRSSECEPQELQPAH